jgi:hypothetical protein
MATGTGKTITALAAATTAFAENRRHALVVLVPYLRLLTQWEEEARAFGYDPVLCSSAHDHWYARASSRIDDFNIGAVPHLTLLAVHATASGDAFQTLLRRLPSDSLLLVADEVHALGTAKLRNALSAHAQLRLGLSATPRRWFDERGTQLLLSYFNGVVFEFGLKEAIGKYLTPYDYNPVMVTLAGGSATRPCPPTAAIRRPAADGRPTTRPGPGGWRSANATSWTWRGSPIGRWARNSPGAGPMARLGDIEKAVLGALGEKSPLSLADATRAVLRRVL